MQLYCESCRATGRETPATTRSSNPDWSGYVLCAECADEYNARKTIAPKEPRSEDDT